MRFPPLALVTLALVCGPAACAVPPQAPEPTRSPEVGAADVARILADIRAHDEGQLAVSEEDGRFLRVTVASRGTRRALEIGAASGYSTIWIGLGLRETGGHLIALEYDPERAREAAENIRRAGLDDIVTVIAGDAFAEIPKIDGTFDFVFLDAWKRDYLRFFDTVFPRVDAGGVFVAHNVINKGDEMPGFLDAINGRPDAWSTIVAPSGEGMSLTYKRRATGADRPRP
jgi:predicted O-methyltransferase YrrM